MGGIVLETGKTDAIDSNSEEQYKPRGSESSFRALFISINLSARHRPECQDNNEAVRFAQCALFLSSRLLDRGRDNYLAPPFPALKNPRFT